MELFELREQSTAILKERGASRERQRLAYQLGDLLDAVEKTISAAGTPEGTRGRAREFLDCILEKAQEHGATFLHEAYLLNFVGEAMVRARYLAEPVIEFLKGGLYFYGLGHIERFHRSRSMGFMAAHADLLVEFTSRAGLRALVAQGREKLKANRPFCIVHCYLNALKKRYWSERRASEDACDVSVALITGDSDDCSTPAEGPEAPLQDVERPPAENRVALMLHMFAHDLSELQQRIYLSRHPLTGDAAYFDSTCQHLLTDDIKVLLGDSPPERERKMTWLDIAGRFGITEKTAKREYLRALLKLLNGSTQAVFGDRVPSSYVRRMMDTLRTIIRERDLRIRDSAGRGLGRIVKRWEIALRFVLNDRAMAASDRGEPPAASSF